MTSESQAAGPAGGSPSTHPDADAFGALPLAVAGARVMLEQLVRIERHEAGARAGEDPEDVHRMRVATRRLRAARRVFRDAMAERVDLERANEELRTLAAALGRVRDLDVFAAALRRHAKGARPADRPALKRLVAARERERTAAQADLSALLDGGAVDYLRGEFHATLLALAAKGPKPRKKGRGDTVRRTAPRRVARALRRLTRAGDSLQAPASTELHELRITAKRARYAAEFFAPAFGDRLDETIAGLTAVQDTLGEVHDADVAVTALLAMVEEVAGGERCADAGPIARLIARYVADRDAHLLSFREHWATLPGAKWLRRRMEGAG